MPVGQGSLRPVYTVLALLGGLLTEHRGKKKPTPPPLPYAVGVLAWTVVKVNRPYRDYLEERQ